MNKQIYDFICEIIKEQKEIVFVGIGTPRCYLDSIGPRICSELIRHYPNVYGTMKDPVHALCIETKHKQIKERHPNATIIAIDAMVSDILGKIIAANGAIKPGAGVGKLLEPIGNHCIKIATVEKGQECYLNDSYLNLSTEGETLRDNLETNVSIISRAIIQALKDNKNII